jgi:hypothetical protein
MEKAAFPFSLSPILITSEKFASEARAELGSIAHHYYSSMITWSVKLRPVNCKQQKQPISLLKFTVDGFGAHRTKNDWCHLFTLLSLESL